jgi:hypothetical protein
MKVWELREKSSNSTPKGGTARLAIFVRKRPACLLACRSFLEEYEAKGGLPTLSLVTLHSFWSPCAGRCQYSPAPRPPASGLDVCPALSPQVEAQANQAGGPPPGVAVQLRNLRKSFAGTRSCSCKYCCCFCTSTPPFHAVKVSQSVSQPIKAPRRLEGRHVCGNSEPRRKFTAILVAAF